MEFKNKVRLCIGIGICALLVGAFSLYYQRTHFNPHTSINGINVGGLTNKEALVRLQKASVDKKIYYHNQLIFEKDNVNMGITQADQAEIDAILKRQFKIFNVNATQNFTLSPKNPTIDKKEMDNVIFEFVKKENLTKTQPKNAYALLKDGKVSVVPAKQGTALDENKMVNQVNLAAGIPIVKLKAIKAVPLLANSKAVALQKAKLKALNNRLLTYKVQNTTYHFSAKQIIKEATFIDNKYQIDASKIDDKLDQINHQKATLDKSYSFRTPDNKMITVTNESYGWL
ncbi:peptidoglycan binding domain-containing protein [Ligilactobacillus hayakitensis]|uniref:peptidoglycan binding domain-containing protein n=1 Tax=Ligilactobacillus hayakitensis TaxID=396716 RepID=UPI0006883301|nr:peptidoglycan binding domain-containing protein [Ligilactobacillus hayakitensis]